MNLFSLLYTMNSVKQPCLYKGLRGKRMRKLSKTKAKFSVRRLQQNYDRTI